MVKQVTEPPPPLPDWVPEPLVELVMHMLEKEPAARPQQMSDVVERLDGMRRAFKTSDFEAKPAGQTVERTPTPARPASGRRAVSTKTPARAPTPTRAGTPRPASQKLPIEPAPARTIATEGLSVNETVPIPTLPKGDPGATLDEELPPLQSSRAPLILGAVVVLAALAGGAVLLTRDAPVDKEPVEVVEVTPTVPTTTTPPPEPVTEVSVRLETTPPGAQVTVAGAVVGATPLTLTRKAGEALELAVTLDGYQPEAKQVSFTADTPVVTLALQRAAPPPKPPKPDGAATPDKPKPDVKPTPDRPKPDVRAPPDKPRPKPKKDELKDLPF
jgi:serine/threonine-protein kinase